MSKIALNVGCGSSTKKDTHYLIKGDEWEHVRVDIDPAVNPDVIDDSSKLTMFPTMSVDAIFSSHNLEHLHVEEAKLALAVYYDRLKVDGICIIIVPSFETACRFIAEGKGNAVVYESPAGPIRALDMIFGYSLYTRDNVYQRHLWGYTTESLAELFTETGFKGVQSTTDSMHNIWAFGKK